MKSETLDPSKCPLCGAPNSCQLCAVSAYREPCWCAQLEIPEALLRKARSESPDKACICRNCWMKRLRLAKTQPHVFVSLSPSMKSRS